MFAMICAAFCVLSAGNAWCAQSYEGMLEPYVTVNLASQVPGILENVAVQRGAAVSRGEVVATLHAGVQRAEVEKAKDMLGFNQRKLTRYKALFKRGNVSANEYDKMETEIKEDQAALREAVLKLDMRSIRSPVNGVVVKVDLAAGDYVGEKPIMTIAQIDPLKVEVVLPETAYGTIHKGMHAEVRPEAPVGGVYTGVVITVDHVINAASGSFIVRVKLPNPELALPSGLECKVRFKK